MPLQIQVNKDRIIEVETLRLIDADGGSLTWTERPGDTADLEVRVAAAGVAGGANDIQVGRILFTETPGAGTYNGTFPLPNPCIIWAVTWYTDTGEAWAATTAVLDVGYTGVPQNWIFQDDVKLGARDFGMNFGAYVLDGEDIVAQLVTTGAGGSTGRTTVIVWYSQPSVLDAVVNATKP